MKPLSDKTAGFTDSVIRRMTRVSNQYGAVNLSQGFPDFDPPKEITDRLREIAPHGPHQYALTWGAQNFREALARKHEHFSGMKVDPNKDMRQYGGDDGVHAHCMQSGRQSRCLFPIL